MGSPEMRQYCVHLYLRPAIVDGHPHWVISCHDDDLIEVGDYGEAIDIASALAAAEARASSKEVEVLVNANGGKPARRIVFGGDISWEPGAESDDGEYGYG